MATPSAGSLPSGISDLQPKAPLGAYRPIAPVCPQPAEHRPLQSREFEMRHPCEPVSLHAYGPSGRMRSKPVCKKIGEQSDAQRSKAAESVPRLDGTRGERDAREYPGEASRDRKGGGWGKGVEG